MHWLQVDLLSWSSVAALTSFAPFDVILDKSTSDAIATSVDREFTSKEDISHLCPTVQHYLKAQPAITLNPVELLSLHLVPLTQKGTTWIALSYSTVRFDSVPSIKDYWTLRSRTALKAPPGPVSSSAHTPEVYHWLYVLDRR